MKFSKIEASTHVKFTQLKCFRITILDWVKCFGDAYKLA